MTMFPKYNVALNYFSLRREKKNSSTILNLTRFSKPKFPLRIWWKKLIWVHVGAWVFKGNVSFQCPLTIMFILGLLWTHLIPESPHFPWVLCGLNKFWLEDVTALWGEEERNRGLPPAEVGGVSGQWSGLSSWDGDIWTRRGSWRSSLYLAK